jgi:adenylosuccinate lyase
MNDTSAFSCISPVDGRYAGISKPLRAYFSEKSLIRYRLLVEVEYFISICELPLPELKGFPVEAFSKLREIYRGCSDADIGEIKEIEKTTNHDIKALEYFLKDAFCKLGFEHFREFIHFGLTSQDVNNTATPLSLKEGMEQVIFPAIEDLLKTIYQLAMLWIKVPMLAHTHGQPASPTTVGKEILVFHERINNQFAQLKALQLPSKFGGATGNFNAHHAAYPEIDWNSFADNFTLKLGLKRSKYTTQIDHYDGLAVIFDCLKRICTIIIDLDRDLWSYISMGYFKQKINAGETGSSTMPHKVNPIDFENSEGNAGIAIAIFEHLSAKLPVSRLQRDLTDSTVLRNVGVPLAHMLIAVKATIKGLGKISLNQQIIDKDLENNMVVVAEAIQTILRRLNYPEPYEKLKELTRKDGPLSREEINLFIDNLDIPELEKQKLKNITPFNYTGIIEA